MIFAKKNWKIRTRAESCYNTSEYKFVQNIETKNLNKNFSLINLHKHIKIMLLDFKTVLE